MTWNWSRPGQIEIDATERVGTRRSFATGRRGPHPSPLLDAPPSTSIAASRLGLVVAFVVIVAMTITVVAPQQSAIVTSMAITEGVPLVAWLIAAFGVGTAVLRKGGANVAPTGDDTLLLTIARIALGLGAISLLTLLLGVTGLLRQSTAIALIAIGDVLAIRHIYKHCATISAWLRGSPGPSWLLLLIAPVFAVMLIGTCVLPGLLWGLDDPSGYDVVAYHLQLPREWYDLGHVTTLKHNVFSFFPLNVEMHSLLAMHLRGGPWVGMYLAQMMHGTFVALTVAAVYAAARSRGRLAASVAAIVCAGVPWMFMLGNVAYVEGGLMLYATLAAAWAIRRRWALAGACAGLACGCKLTGVPVAGVLVVAVVIVRGLGRVARPRSADESDPSAIAGTASTMKGIFVFTAVALLVFSPWLIRTAIASGGNPIFPLALRTLGHGDFDAGQVDRFEAAHSPRDDQHSPGARFKALWQQVGGDYHYGAIAIGGITLPLWLALIVPALVLARRDPEATIWILLVAGNVAIWLFATHLQGRFLVHAIPFVAMLVVCAISNMEGGSPCSFVGTKDTDQRHEVMPSKWFAAIAMSVTVASFVSSARTPLKTLLASPGPLNALGISGRDELRQLLPDDNVARVVYDTDRPIALLGDAKAFWYAIPSSRLRYRSVFDVGSAGFRDGWLGAGVPPDAAVCVDLIELTRFYRTYRRLPEGYYTWDTRSLGSVIRVDDVPR
jgi:hypothetical protein